MLTILSVLSYIGGIIYLGGGSAYGAYAYGLLLGIFSTSLIFIISCPMVFKNADENQPIKHKPAHKPPSPTPSRTRKHYRLTYRNGSWVYVKK